MAAAGFLSRCLNGPLPYDLVDYNTMGSLEPTGVHRKKMQGGGGGRQCYPEFDV